MAEFEKNNDYTLGKSERLSSKKVIASLFSQGRQLSIPPFVIRYLSLKNDATHHQIMVSVSKKHFKHAVDRNRIKRQIKEAYRLNKHILADLPHKCAIAYIYIGKEMPLYQTIENKLIESLIRLIKEYSKQNEN